VIEEYTPSQLVNRMMAQFESNWGKQPAEIRLGYVQSKLVQLLEEFPEALDEFRERIKLNEFELILQGENV
jgi:hypothetical protein